MGSDGPCSVAVELQKDDFENYIYEIRMLQGSKWYTIFLSYFKFDLLLFFQSRVLDNLQVSDLSFSYVCTNVLCGI